MAYHSKIIKLLNIIDNMNLSCEQPVNKKEGKGSFEDDGSGMFHALRLFWNAPPVSHSKTELSLGFLCQA